MSRNYILSLSKMSTRNSTWSPGICLEFEVIHILKKLKLTLFTRVTQYSLKTDKPVALEFPIELEFRNVDFGSGTVKTNDFVPVQPDFPLF